MLSYLLISLQWSPNQPHYLTCLVFVSRTQHLLIPLSQQLIFSHPLDVKVLESNSTPFHIMPSCSIPSVVRAIRYPFNVVLTALRGWKRSASRSKERDVSSELKPKTRGKVNLSHCMPLTEKMLI